MYTQRGVLTKIQRWRDELCKVRGLLPHSLLWLPLPPPSFLLLLLLLHDVNKPAGRCGVPRCTTTFVHPASLTMDGDLALLLSVYEGEMKLLLTMLRWRSNAVLGSVIEIHVGFGPPITIQIFHFGKDNEDFISITVLLTY